MKIKYILLLIVASGLILSSCNDQLDTEQLGVVDGQKFYNTDNDAEEAAVAIYGCIQDAAWNLTFLKLLLSDDVWAGGGSRGDNANNEIINEYIFTSDAQMIRDPFSTYYTIIYRANLILNNVEPNSDSKRQNIAEAHFFRAWAYFDLVTLWGTAPLVTQAEREDYREGNSTIEALWEQIEFDLNEAIQSRALPEKKSIDDNITGIRITHQLAQAVLGKAYVFQEKYQEAMVILDEVVNSNKYKLFDGEYGDIFLAANNNNCESMFEINKVADPSIYSFSILPMAMGWRPEKFSNIYQLTDEGKIDVHPNGFGMCVPTQSLYNAFVAAEGINGYRLNGTIKSYDYLNGNIGLEIAPGQHCFGSEGYFVWKNRASSQSFLAGTWAGFWNNDRYMRYAEVLLLAAEAQILGGGSKGDEYLNMVRQRAKLSPISGATLEDVKIEKRLELCMEGARYQDIIRWGNAAELLKDQGKKIPAFYGYESDGIAYDVRYEWGNPNAGFKVNKNELLPFPQAELDVNPNIRQNRGWGQD